MNTIKEAIAILKAMEEGKTIQVKLYDGCWNDLTGRGFPHFHSDEYRIKPEPVTRLLTADELPDVIWLKNKRGSVFQVTGVCDGMLIAPTTSERGCCIQFLKDEGVLWSDSRKGPWKSFETEEEAK